jgi:hypothetical protein
MKGEADYWKYTITRTTTKRMKDLVHLPTIILKMLCKSLISYLTDLQHNLFLLTFGGKLGLAPPAAKDSTVRNALDLGTGTGIWAMDFGDEHPNAKVEPNEV